MSCTTRHSLNGGVDKPWALVSKSQNRRGEKIRQLLGHPHLCLPPSSSSSSLSTTTDTSISTRSDSSAAKSEGSSPNIKVFAHISRVGLAGGRFWGDGAWRSCFPFAVGSAQHINPNKQADNTLAVIALPAPASLATSMWSYNLQISSETN